MRDAKENLTGSPNLVNSRQVFKFKSRPGDSLVEQEQNKNSYTNDFVSFYFFKKKFDGNRRFVII